MAGGLLNIVSVGNNNVFLTGNPSKTFFKVTYAKYTNFGLQKFRVDYDGSRELRLTDTSVFTFKIPRYAELLMDTYLVLNLPDIWSPIYNPSTNTNGKWSPYEFKWIRNIGTNIIKEVVVSCGSLILQRYTGEYFGLMVERDFTSEKKDLFNKMSGNDPELYDPANSFGRSNVYPSARYTKTTPATPGSEPSIRGRQLYIPINTWFTLNHTMAFPLICLQYNELIISVTLRPIQELFQIRDIFNKDDHHPYIQPDFTKPQFQMYRFLQTPPPDITNGTNYNSQVSVWNADVHLLSTYCFLSPDESKRFAMSDQVYLVKDIFWYNFDNVTGASRLKLNSTGMVSSWLWFLQRNDVNKRNEWSNYTNYPYTDVLPNKLVLDPLSNLAITGEFQITNQREILQTMGILLDGEYRENVLNSGIYNFVEKYTRTNGFATDGVYCYNFCLNTNPFEYQPSGAININRFKNVQLEITTFVPPIDPNGSLFNLTCADLFDVVSVKSQWQLYGYNFNLVLYEERYNILSFIGGNCGMLYAR